GDEVPVCVVGVGGRRRRQGTRVRRGHLAGQLVVGVVGVGGDGAVGGGGLGHVVVAVIHRRWRRDGDRGGLLRHLLPLPAEHVVGLGGEVAQRVGDRGDIAARVVDILGGRAGRGRLVEAPRLGDRLRVPGRV